MKVGFPQPSEGLLEGKGDVPSRAWRRFFSDFWRSMGFSYEAPIYGDIFIDPLAMNVGASGVTTPALFGALIARHFPDAATNSLYFAARLPNNYRDGTALKPYIEWAPTSSAAGSVVWALEYEAKGDGETFGTSATITETSVSPGAEDKAERVEFDDITGTGKAKGDIVLCRIARTGAAAGDTYAADAALLSFGFKYQIDGAGHELAHPGGA